MLYADIHAAIDLSGASASHRAQFTTYSSIPLSPVQVRSPHQPPLLPVNPLGLLDEPDLKRLGALPDEANEPLPFFGHGIAVLLEQWLEELDEQRDGAALTRDLPRSTDGAVEKHGTLGRDPLTVLVGDERVRSAGESSTLSYSGRKRGGGVGVGQRGVGQAEQLVAVLVAEGTQAWP